MGDASSYATLAEQAASMGYVAVSINYRLVQNPGTANESSYWPDQIVDLQLAVRWLRDNAATYGIDPNEIAAWGGSAGGTLAVFLGALGTIYPGDEAGLYTNQSPSVSLVVDDFGPVDFTVSGPETLTSSGINLADSSDPSALAAISPIFDISPSSAPMYIVHGTLDTTIPISQSEELYSTLQADGVPAQFVTYDGGHGFAGLGFTQQQQIPTTASNGCRRR